MYKYAFDKKCYLHYTLCTIFISDLVVVVMIYYWNYHKLSHNMHTNI